MKRNNFGSRMANGDAGVFKPSGLLAGSLLLCLDYNNISDGVNQHFYIICVIGET